MGPVEYCELRRLISARLGVVDIGMILGLRVVGGGELGVGADMEVTDWVGVRIYLCEVIGGRGAASANGLYGNSTHL